MERSLYVCILLIILLIVQFKSEQLRLRWADERRGFVQAHGVALHSHLWYVFFRPEEYGVGSIVADYVSAAEGPPIELRQEQVWVCSRLVHPPMESFVHLNVHRARAMRAGGRDLYLQRFVSEASFDEGRGKGILRSSAEDVLPGAESQLMRCRVTGHGESPTNFAARIPD